MTRTDPRRPLTTVAALLLVSAIALAGCANNNGSSSTATTGAATTVAVGTTVAFDKSIQQDLAEVGCYPGAVDGILGPASDAAILAFQGGAGLGTDGQLGPQTHAALTKAAADRTKVCTGSTTTTANAATTTTIAGAVAPCTATALIAALDPGAQLTAYICSEGYAGVKATAANHSGTQEAYQAILKANGATWTNLSEQPCVSASAGIPAAVVALGCAP